MSKVYMLIDVVGGEFSGYAEHNIAAFTDGETAELIAAYLNDFIESKSESIISLLKLSVPEVIEALMKFDNYETGDLGKVIGRDDKFLIEVVDLI